MKTLEFWFDPISPYAWLAFDALPQTLTGLSVRVRYRPVLLAGLLAHAGQKGPAEIPAKRLWTYRDVLWRAHRQGLQLDLPDPHPFNPLPLLRRCLACAPADGLPSRLVVETVFRHVWIGGADPLEPARLAALDARLPLRRDPEDPSIKARLRENTEHAIAHGLFGVPTLETEGRAFWGADALDALSACLRGDIWFDGPAWATAAAPRRAVTRR